ncbi:MAG: sulfotransferase [Oscillatoria sp. PMC 1068.18]|nr:sulfotransferase [Oscillatoria sp. PMC 1068.18]
MAKISSSATTYQQPDRPLEFSLLNLLGDKVNLDWFPLLDLSEDSLLEAAQRQTGLADWGDESFRLRLRKLLESLDREANLNLVGRYFLRQYCLKLLVNRLQMQADFKRYPEILSVPIQKPLFIVGLFRSGTTFLHNLLGCDRASRWLHLGEALNPSPPPIEATWKDDPRLVEEGKWIEFENSLAPKFATAHYINVDRPAECSRLFEHDFVAHLFDFRANVNSYSEWLQNQDLVDSYQDYRQQLQYLSWHWRGDRWLMKAPAHIFALDALLAVFPDACIVQTHRDPLKVIPSVCSLSAIARSRFSDRVEPQEIGKHWLNLLTKGVEDAMQVRETADAARFYDVDYLNFVRDPIATVTQIYEYFGYELTPETTARMKDWIEQNPQHKRGVHKYSLDQFGLDPQQVKEKFAQYRDRYHLDRE